MLKPLYGDYFDEREVLREAINIALAKGWHVRSWEGNFVDEVICAFDVYKYGIRKITFFNEDMTRIQIPVYEIIFNHDFAQYIFGNNGDKVYRICRTDHADGHCGDWDCDDYEYAEGYQIHLPAMVLDKKPIQYLARYIVENNLEAPADA